MATAAVARPSQALRQRRDAPRPTAAKRSITMDANGTSEQASKKRKLDEPYVRDSAYILRKFKGKPVSLTIHLHPTHFKFEGQDGSFPYEGDASFVLKHLKHGTVPHEMMEELLSNNIPWYDGCLIVEIHNHRNLGGKGKGRNDSATEDDTEKFGMHNYNHGLTPSPMVPYPSQAKQAEEEEKKERTNGDMEPPERPKEKDGPRVFTVVLHPTDLSFHHEVMILANTPASEMRNKKRGSDSATPSSAHPPPTPQLSVPPTPISQTARGSSTQSQKMCLEGNELYTFQADMLMATAPPLYLEPVDNPQDSQKILDMLSHPLHQEQPPSSKTRKRTTAEVAAEDAQNQATERRMLIQDDRKNAGAGAAQNDNQTAPASLTFSRFKTLDLVRQKAEESERQKKEDEFRASAEKKAQEEAAAMQHKAAMAQRQREMMMAQQQQGNQAQNLMMQHQQSQAQIRARAMAAAQQQAQMNAQNHAHPQQTAMMQAQQQNYQNQVSMPQSSPIVRNQTPMINSSPMMPQGGFPMVPTSSQGGAGSPPRPQSAVIQNPMARQVSQQQGSRNGTPQLQQGTPSMGQAIPNRQMAQTPRMPPGSPAPHGMQQTPTMAMQTPQVGNQTQFTPEQIQMLQQQHRNTMAQGQQMAAGQAGSPTQNMTPEQFQHIQNQRRQQQHQQFMQRQQMLQAQANNGDQGAAAQLLQLQQQQQHRQAAALAQQQRSQLMQAQMNAQRQAQAGSPGVMPQQTPQIAHAHPQQQGNMQDPSQMTQQQQTLAAQARASQLAQARAQHQNPALIHARQQLSALAQRYGGLTSIPPNIIQTLPAQMQQILHSMVRQSQMQARQQQMQQAQQQQNANGEQVPGGQANPEYMQRLRDNRAMLGQHMQNQQQQQGQVQAGNMAGMNGMTGLSFHMGGMNQNAAFGNQQNGADLTQQFAAMQNALTRGQPGGQGMQ